MGDMSDNEQYPFYAESGRFSQWVGLAEMARMLAALEQFMDSFELVFHYDWEFTKYELPPANEFTIHPEGTFLEPGVDDESNNWHNRGSLLANYRRLRHELGLLDGKFHEGRKTGILDDASREGIAFYLDLDGSLRGRFPKNASPDRIAYYRERKSEIIAELKRRNNWPK